jgi:hypothetical protein
MLYEPASIGACLLPPIDDRLPGPSSADFNPTEGSPRYFDVSDAEGCEYPSSFLEMGPLVFPDFDFLEGLLLLEIA